jgi:hypothetical protein
MRQAMLEINAAKRRLQLETDALRQDQEHDKAILRDVKQQVCVCELSFGGNSNASA